MKRFQAFLAALVITGLMGLGVWAIGFNALLNTDRAPVAQASGASDNASIDPNAGQAQDQIAQLKGLIAQYQQREKQYQVQLDDAAQKLNEANQQVQDLQNVMTALQDRGIIRILDDGTIQLRVRTRGGN